MTRDVLIVGGGITGLSLAVHAARRGMSVTLCESGPLGGLSTQRSGALVRTHYVDPSSARLALRGLRDFEDFAGTYGGPAGFVATGFVYVPEPGEPLRERVAMLQELGVETSVVDGDEMHALDPALDLSDVDEVAFEPCSGFADPAVTCATLASAARAAGAELRPGTAVASLLHADSGVAGALLADGSMVEAGATVLCAGAFSPALAAPVGASIPIRPTAVKLAFIERRVASHLTVIDAPGGIYLRPDPSGATLVGRRTWTDEPLASASAPLPEVDEAFVSEARELLAARLPSAAGAAVVSTRAGMLDMTPDGLPLVGPSSVDGLWLCCGWSGTGFKTGPAVGDALAAWIDTGEMDPDLAGLVPDREMHAAEAVRSPH
ncbi:MAG: FAD-binding oxidoreductase [Solirubrobacteraceae bacterium]|nr:FAD-binding oxidoreductase [Solirubrobacteraceae bacterium]